MIKRYLKNWLIVFSIIGSAYAIIYACGGESYWPDVNNFKPNSYNDYYSPNLFESWGQLPDPEYYDARFNDSVLKDWKGYLNNAMNENELYQMLFECPRHQIDSLYSFYTSGEKNRVTDSWSEKINLQNPIVISLIEFMHYAKAVEVFALNSSHYEWRYKGAEKPVMDTALIQELTQKFKTTTHPFLKNRYWFQTIKACFYSENSEQTIAFFEETEKQMPHNLLYYRAMNYVAGVYNHAQQFAEANYTYSLIFNNCEALQADASYGFHPMENEDWEASLTLAKNADEKATLWALFGYYADEIKAIDEIFKIAPKNRHLDYLLASIIDKEEHRINDDIEYSYIDGNPLNNFANYKLKFKEIQNTYLLELVDRIAKTEQTKSPYLWHLALGYLNILNGNHQEATTYINKAEKSLTLNNSGKNQIRLMRFINTLSEMDTITAVNETKLYTDLKWIYEENQKPDSMQDYYYHPPYEAAVSWSKKYLYYLYKAKDDKIMRELFVRTDEIFENENDFMAMRAFLLNPQKTNFEKMAVSLYNLTVEDIDDYRAVRYGYENKIDEAIAIMAKLPIERQQEFGGNPFNGKIKDCNDCDHQAKQKVKYNRLTILLKMKELKEKITKKEDVYTNALLLANAFYNISEFGNARVYYQNNIIGGYFYYTDNIPNTFKPLLLDMTMAKKYYKLALDSAQSDEQRAKCWYLLAKCERNEFYNLNYYFEEGDGNNPEGKDFLAWEGFKMLKEKYSKTKYYKEAIAECGYFKTYIKQSKRK